MKTQGRREREGERREKREEGLCFVLEGGVGFGLEFNQHPLGSGTVSETERLCMSLVSLTRRSNEIERLVANITKRSPVGASWRQSLPKVSTLTLRLPDKFDWSFMKVLYGSASIHLIGYACIDFLPSHPA